jgi:hypothetical protein
MLLQQGADPTLRNSEGKTALDVADPLTRPVLSEADYRKDELLEVARSGESGQTHLSAFHPLFHFFVTMLPYLYGRAVCISTLIAKLPNQMRIRILLLVKVMRICDLWSTDLPGLQFEPPRLHCERHGSILSI